MVYIMIVAGIDIGAISTKTVILNNNQFMGYNIIETGLFPKQAAVNSLNQSLQQCKLAQNQINHIVATGHGRRTIDFANSVKTEIVMTCNIREWRHVLNLRCSPAAHPQMREVMLPLLTELHEKIPVFFDDIYRSLNGE